MFRVNEICHPHLSSALLLTNPKSLQINFSSLNKCLESVWTLPVDWGTKCSSLSWLILVFPGGPHWIAGQRINTQANSSIFQCQCTSLITIISEMIVKFHVQNTLPRLFLLSPPPSLPVLPQPHMPPKDKFPCSPGSGHRGCLLQGLHCPLGLPPPVQLHPSFALVIYCCVMNLPKLSVMKQQLLYDACGCWGLEI